MKPYYSLLLALLFTLSFTAIIYADTSQIGPGIDTGKGSALYFGPQTYDMYPFGNIYIEFQAPENGTYTFYAGWGTVEEHASGYVQFELTNNNDDYVKDVVITFSDGVTFHTEELFTVYLTSGTYRLWIKPSFEDGSLMLWGYDASTDPSVSYYNHPQYGWMQIEDLAWFALYSTSGGASTIPMPKATYDPNSIWADDKYVYVKITIWNWKNGTTITIARYDEILDTYTDQQEYTVENISVQTIIAKFSRINGGEVSGDYIYISGYDLNGNFYSTRLEPFNITVAPKGWIDQVREWFDALYSYASNIVQVVITILPWSGALWAVAFMGSIIKCVQETSLNPLFDFLYKNYQLLTGLASLTLKIVEKTVDVFKFLGDVIIKAITFLIG